MKKLKRANKKGYVYLLEATEDDGKVMYKYGCTALPVKNRVSKINSSNKYKLKFKVITYFESKDIFGDENKVRWHILPCGFGGLSEYIPSFEGDEVCVISNFRKILSHCKEVSECTTTNSI